MTSFAVLLLSAAAVVAQPSRVRAPYNGAIAVDARSGAVLMSDRADQECYQASCTKLMTVLLVLESFERGEVTLSDLVPTTPESARELPSLSGMRHPDSMSLDNLLKVLMVKSGNDAAVMVAQYVASKTHPEITDGPGRLAAFVADMNRTAAALGMTNTVFVTPNGMPPPRNSKRGFDRSTAADMAKLAVELLKKHPEVLGYTSLKSCSVTSAKGDRFEYTNHNNLLVGSRKDPSVRLPGVDGLKTGYHDAGGLSVVVTASERGKRAIVVVLGSPSARDRDRAARRILTDALGYLDL